MGRLFIITATLMAAVACSTQHLANTSGRIDRDIETAVRDSVHLEALSVSIEDRVRTLSDRSLIKVTYYYPPQDGSSERGAVYAEMEIRADVTSKDSTSRSSTEEETMTQETDSVAVDRSVITTMVKEKEPLAWWQKALMWTGAAAFLMLILTIIWKIYKPKIL